VGSESRSSPLHLAATHRLISVSRSPRGGITEIVFILAQAIQTGHDEHERLCSIVEPSSGHLVTTFRISNQSP
jgi:hypothetical protein